MSVFHAVVFDFSNMRWEAKLLVLTLLVMVVVAVCAIVIEQIKSIKRAKRARHRQTRWVNKSTNEDFFNIITRLRNDIDPGYLYPGSPMTMDPYRHLYVNDMTADEAFATVPR